MHPPTRSEGDLLRKDFEVREVELPNVIQTEDQHGESLEPHAPGAHRPHAAQWLSDLRPEDACTPEFEPSSAPFDLHLQ